MDGEAWQLTVLGMVTVKQLSRNNNLFPKGLLGRK